MESNKVRLRAMEPEALDLLYEIENDIETWHVGAVNVPYSRYLLHDYIAHATGDIYADRQLRLIIEDKKGNSVGLIDLVDFDPQHSRAEVGIILQTKHRRLVGSRHHQNGTPHSFLSKVFLYELQNFSTTLSDKGNHINIRLDISGNHPHQSRLSDTGTGEDADTLPLTNGI